MHYCLGILSNKDCFVVASKKIGETETSAGVAVRDTSRDSVYESRDNLGDGAVDKLLVGLGHHHTGDHGQQTWATKMLSL